MGDLPDLAGPNQLTGWEWNVAEWIADRLTLIGDTDLSYHHRVEISFSGVDFVSVPAEFVDARFGAASSVEREDLDVRIGHDPELTVWAIDAEAVASMARSRFFVRAIRVSVAHGTVFHYWRDRLQPGERIAPWVPPPTDQGNPPE